jgi:predicted nucleic acid-binding protein
LIQIYFLDVVLKRDDYIYSVKLLNAIEQGLFKAYISDITLLNIDYIAKKQIKDIKPFLSLINETFTVLGANNEIFSKALSINNKDIEDNVQYICAKQQKCNYIITNDKTFYKKDIKLITSQNFTKKHLQDTK